MRSVQRWSRSAALFLALAAWTRTGATASAVDLSVRSVTGNDTLYVGLPGAVVFSATNSGGCLEAINWWCEWTVTNDIALGDLRRFANPIWSTEAGKAFESLEAELLVDLTSPDTTLVTAGDLGGSTFQSAHEICRFDVIPRNVGTVSFVHQFTTGPPTWQTTVDLCGGSRVVPTITSPDITIVPCAAGQLVGGDVDFSRSFDLGDIAWLVGMVFKMTPAPAIANFGDANCDSRLSGADIIHLVGFLFRGGEPPCDPCLTVTKNHLPETILHLDTLEALQPTYVGPRVVRPREHYSIPQATATYAGIPVSWSASDSLDQLTTHPVFGFNWVMFGPFPDQASAVADSDLIVRTNDQPGTPELEWTTDTSCALLDLRTGWYLFQVRSRDDSLAIDSTPAQARVSVVEPAFERPFLLMDATNWLNGQLLNAGSYMFREPRTDSLTADTLRALYEDLFSNQGYAFDTQVDVWYRQTSACADCYSVLPDRHELGRYRTLVVYDEDMQMPLDMDNLAREYETRFREYMNIGGRVVLIGRNLFGRTAPGWTNISAAMESVFGPGQWAHDYFGLTRMYFPGHLHSVLHLSADTADFMSGIALDPAFPAVLVDTMFTLKLSQIPVGNCPQCIDRDGDLQPDWLWVPDVNWVGIDSSRGAAGLYQFVSELPNTSPSHGRRCGTKFVYYDTLLQQSTFRSALVTFPLSTLVRDDSLRQMAKGLLDFVLTDTVYARIPPPDRR